MSNGSQCAGLHITLKAWPSMLVWLAYITPCHHWPSGEPTAPTQMDLSGFIFSSQLHQATLPINAMGFEAGEQPVCGTGAWQWPWWLGPNQQLSLYRCVSIQVTSRHCVRQSAIGVIVLWQQLVWLQSYLGGNAILPAGNPKAKPPATLISSGTIIFAIIP